jgi:hypothetical protein
MESTAAKSHIQNIVKNNLQLKHYERRVSIASEYFDYYTGLLDGRLKRIISRESTQEFLQRTSLTNHVSKAILNSAKLPFQKATRKNPLTRTIDFDQQAESKQRELLDIIAKFNGARSLDQFLENSTVEYNFTDPNAFLITEFLPNKDKTEKVKPYPFVATSNQVVDYNYINGIIDYVVVRLKIKYVEDGKEYDGYKYTMYLGNSTIVYKQIGVDQKQQGFEYMEFEKSVYEFNEYIVKAETDPELTPAAIQFGYIGDPETNYETFVSIFDCALPYLRKTLKTNSELDQSMAMMAFPQRYRYVTNCTNEGCNKGQMPDGADCPVCGGTGKAQVHKGAQDIQELSMPKDPAEIFDLAKLAYDHSPNIELLKFQDEYIKGLKKDIHTTIFNNDIFAKPQVTQTATESNIEVDNMNDTLYPFCRKYSQIWKHTVYYIAVFTEFVKKKGEGADIIIHHEFPKDLKMKSLGELMADLKSAYDSKASTSTIAAIEDDINSILYYDRPDELKKINVQQSFNPFRGYTPDDIRYFFASNLTTKFNQILYSNYANIWLELEKVEKPWIYDMETNKIWELVTKQVEKIKADMEAEAPKPVMQLDFNNKQA